MLNVNSNPRNNSANGDNVHTTVTGDGQSQHHWWVSAGTGKTFVPDERPTEFPQTAPLITPHG